jgi:penicillin-binding protein-related factor A (putative recombinase)
MKERELLSSFGKELSRYGIWYKIPDSGKQQRFAIEKPFDGFYAQDGVTVAIEAKIHKAKTAWPVSSIEDHQIRNMTDVMRHGWRSSILLFVVDRLKRPFTVTGYFISLQAIEEYTRRENRKSIPVSDIPGLSDAACAMDRRTGRWEMSEFVKWIE